MSIVRGVGAKKPTNMGEIVGLASVGAGGVCAVQAVAVSVPEDRDETLAVASASGLATLIWWSPMDYVPLPAVGGPPVGSAPVAGENGG